MRKRIGLFGGTFNPIHNAHLFLGQCALEEENLDEVIFIPSGISYCKDQSEIVSADIRVEMTKLATCGHDKFSVSTIESSRAKNSYSYETILTFREKMPDTDFFLIIGGDNFFSIEYWKNASVIFDNVRLLVAHRGEHSEDALRQKKRNLEERFGAQISFLHMKDMPISSTMIRKALYVRDEDTCLQHLPPAVYAYIKANHLYKNNG